MTRWIHAAILTGMVAAVLAAPSALAGTEADPELSDPEGDVTYDPLYQGGPDEPYLDVVAAWFDHNVTTDKIHFTMKVADATPLESLPNTHYLWCSQEAVLAWQGEEVSRVSFRWSMWGGDTPESRVLASSKKNDSINPISGDVKHGFNVTADAPGYYTFELERSQLVLLGDEIKEVRGPCTREYRPLAGTDADGVGAYYNYDATGSQKPYNYAHLVPSRANESTENGTARPANMTDEPDARSPGVATGVVLVAVAFLAAARRQRH